MKDDSYILAKWWQQDRWQCNSIQLTTYQCTIKETECSPRMSTRIQIRLRSTLKWLRTNNMANCRHKQTNHLIINTSGYIVTMVAIQYNNKESLVGWIPIISLLSDNSTIFCNLSLPSYSNKPWKITWKTDYYYRHHKMDYKTTIQTLDIPSAQYINTGVFPASLIIFHTTKLSLPPNKNK